MKPRPIAGSLMTLFMGLLTTLNVSAMPPLPPPNGPMPCHGAMAGDFEPQPPFLHGISLTEAQKDQVFAIMHRAAPTLRTKEREVWQAHRALHELALSATYDEPKAKSIADAAARAMTETALLHADVNNQIFGLLTPGQRKQIAAGGPQKVGRGHDAPP